MRRIGLFVGSDIFSWIICHNLIATSPEGFEYEVIFPVMRQVRNLPVDLNMLATYERNVARDVIYPFVESNLHQCNGLYLPPAQFLSSKNVRFKHVEDINDPKYFEKEVEPLDGIISIRCYQKFSSIYVERFSNRGRILWNLHPGDLPEYRGVMTHYRAMINQDQYVALTLHEMTADWDDGPIISKYSIPLNMEISFLENMIFLAILGSGVLQGNLMRLNASGRYSTINQVDANYWSFPAEQEIAHAQLQGVRLVDHRGVLELYSNLFIGESSSEIVNKFKNAFDSYIKLARSC